MNIATDYPLQAHHTFGVDITTAYYCQLTDRAELSELFTLPEPYFILGGGSNVLFTKNYEGTVIHNSLKGIELIGEDDLFYTVRVAAGETWHQFVLTALENHWYGLETLSLIPGTVGAAPIQNIGAYGTEVGEWIESVEVYDREREEIYELSNAECRFRYRHSYFKECYGRYLVLSVSFRLAKTPQTALRYQVLEEWFVTHSEPITPQNIVRAVTEIRQSKLPDPAIIGNAGSFFHNPILGREQYESLKRCYPNLIAYPQSEGRVKLAAGQLIELAGFKGVYRNQVGMYEKQALILVNLGGATGEALYQHAKCVAEGVKKKFQISLVPEPIIL